MSMLDRAFVRAYSRSRTSAPNHSADSEAQGANHNATMAPYRSPASTPAPQDSMWHPFQIGANGLDESYFRVDVGHMPVPHVQRQTAAATQAVAGTSTATKTQMGSGPVTAAAAPTVGNTPKRPAAEALSHTLTAFDGLPHSGQADLYMRFDPSHDVRHTEPVPVNADTEIDYRHINLQTDEALAFALAKAEALRQPAAAASKPTLASAIMRDLAEARVLQQQLAEQKEEELRRHELELIAEQNHQAQIERLEKFTQRPTPSTPKPFHAVWEVDAFEFSDIVVRLFGQSSLLDSIGTPLDQAVANGLKSMLITSQERGVGRTSVAIGIAVAAAAAGLNVALLDADLSTGGLAESLRLEVAQDWLTAVRLDLPLEEAAVRSIEDQLTVLPCNATKPGAGCSAEEFDSVMKRLRSRFDLVIVDGAPWNQSAISMQQVTTIDAAIVVVNAKSQDSTALKSMQLSLRDSGILGLGLVENFS